MPVSNSWRRLGRAEKSVVFTVSRSGTRENYGANACGAVAQGTRPVSAIPDLQTVVYLAEWDKFQSQPWFSVPRRSTDWLR